MRQNKRELIQAVFHNEKADRIPVGFWHHFLQDEVGADAFSHPQLTEKALEGQADFYQAFEPDMIKIMTDGFFGYPHPLLQKVVNSPKELMAITPLGEGVRMVCRADPICQKTSVDIWERNSAFL